MKRFYLIIFILFSISFFNIGVDVEAFFSDCGTYNYSGACGFARGAGSIVGNVCNGDLTVCVPSYTCTRYQEYDDLFGTPIGNCGDTESCVQCGCAAACVAGGNCGNNVVDAFESCDDGNLISGDGCDSACSVEDGSGGGPLCGDGNLDAGEACDDNNNTSGDGCSSACVIEGALICTNAPFNASNYSGGNKTITKGDTGVITIGMKNTQWMVNSINVNVTPSPALPGTFIVKKSAATGFNVNNPIAVNNLFEYFLNIEIQTSAATPAGNYTLTIDMDSLVDSNCAQTLSINLNVIDVVGTPAPTIDLQVDGNPATTPASPLNVPRFGASAVGLVPVNLTWNVGGVVNSCTASKSASAPGAWSGNVAVSGGTSLSPFDTNGTYSYDLTCSGPGGVSSKTAYVRAPTCNNTAFDVGQSSVSPASVTQGGAYGLSCNYGNSNKIPLALPGSGSCAWGGWVGNTANFNCTAGTVGTYNNHCRMTQSDPYYYCSSTDTINNLSVTALGGSAPVVSFNAIPNTIVTGGFTDLSYSYSDADSCLLNPPVAVITVPPSHTDSSYISVGPLTTPPNSKNYTLSCSNAFGTTLRTTVVNINPTPPVSLNVVKSGQGTVTGSSNPAQTNINCGPTVTCSATYTAGTIITLTATPNAGRIFTGWGQACSGSGRNPTCTFAISANTAVTANFAVDPDFKEF